MSKSKKSTPEISIYEEYFNYVKQYQALYGKKTIVLLQVGAFFEVYGMKNAAGDYIENVIEEFAECCELNISDKKITYKNGAIVMAGFRDFTIDKYLLKLTENGFTVPVFVQEKDGKTVTRTLNRVYSPGTYLSCDTDVSPKITNNIMCIWMDVFKPIISKGKSMRDTIVYGLSVVNIFTGKSSMFQYETQFYMNMTTFDEMERYISIYAPSEVIILSPFQDKELTTILRLTGLHPQMIHSVSLTTADDKVSRCKNQKYMKQMLSQLFGSDVMDVCSEFGIHNMATQSFCYLLNFIQEHNPDLIRKISMPEFNNTSYRMILANHTLLQLNIINDLTLDAKNAGQYSSILSFLNKCCTSMGKRRFQHQLLNPTFDEEWLSKEYEMTSLMLREEYNYFVDVFRKQLNQVRDIEKLCRQIVMKKIYPASLYHLYHSVEIIQQINTCLFESTQVCDYLCADIKDNTEGSYDFIQNLATELMKFMNDHLVMDACKSVTSMSTFDENIIRPGISASLDEASRIYNESQAKFFKIHRALNDLIQKHENSPDTEYVKVHETEKSGVCLQITAKRSLALKKILDKIVNGQVDIDAETKILVKDIKFPKASSTTVEIDFPILNQVCKDLLIYKDRMNVLIAETYLTILQTLETIGYDKLEKLAEYASKLDVLQSKTYVAKEYHYCCPTIQPEVDKSFFEAKEMRHCLIEHLQKNEIYVTNDLSLGNNELVDGILLYGTNAVGKTSLIRATGVCVIMAQTGMFVPCSQFTYKPYTAIFSRILGNDNIFKGLSTFAVEMTELRIILKMSDENSLILGDELCSGTETESALSIFAAGLMDLHAKQSSFIFATHFHEIVNYEEINTLVRLSMKHMAVHYDREQDCLVYDRKLKDGSGPRTYGLEVCKSLYLEEEFLERAYAIRNKYYPDTRGSLSHTTSTYNAEKIRGTCEKCGEKIAAEIHHLNPQKNADTDGFIGTFHKNHVANLLSVCEKCHDEIHSSEQELVRKKTTKGYKLLSK